MADEGRYECAEYVRTSVRKRFLAASREGAKHDFKVEWWSCEGAEGLGVRVETCTWGAGR